MNILFIGIFDDNEPNLAFRNALKLAAKGHYTEIAHHRHKSKFDLQIEIVSLIKNKLFKPDLVFMQLQGANIIGEAALQYLKNTGAFLCQWTGDVRQPLPYHYIEFGRKIDLSLFTNQDDVDAMKMQGVNADYLQVSADHNIYTPNGPKKLNSPEIVFMGNNYNCGFHLTDYRLKMCTFLKQTYGDRFAVYGNGYPKGFATGDLMFNQITEATVYRSCKVAINCSHYDLKKYTSDRFFRILLSGAFCLTKEFPEMEHYFENKEQKQKFAAFKEDNNFSDLKNAIDYYLKYDDIRQAIAKNGSEYARENWTWPHRINELFELIKKWNTKLSFQPLIK